MATRKRAKSKDDIYLQWHRLYNSPNITPQREEVIAKARDRYVNNINNSKVGKIFVDEWRKRYYNGHPDTTKWAVKGMTQKYTGYTNPDTTKAVGLNKG